MSKSKLCNIYSHCTTLFLANRSSELKQSNLDSSTRVLAMQHLISIVVPIIFGLIAIVGLLGNALVVVVVVANSQMRSTTNLLIVNLAFADILFIVFCVPFTASDYALTFWPFGDVWCKIVQYLVIVTVYASIYTLVLMSIDRYLAVVHPFTSKSIRTKTNAYWAITITWVVIFASCTPLLMAHGQVIYHFAGEEYSGCRFLHEEGWNQCAFQIAFFVTSYVVPLLLICGLYVDMLVHLWKRITPGAGAGMRQRDKNLRVTRMVCIVVGLFAICWFPIQLCLVLKSLALFGTTPATVMIQITSHILAYMNSCINPFLYAFISNNFVKSFRKIINCPICISLCKIDSSQGT